MRGTAVQTHALICTYRHPVSQYYWPYLNTTVDKRSVPEPNVNVDIVPGCNLLRNQFAVANYTGPLACNLQGAGPGASNSSAPACVVSPLFVAA